MFKIKYSPVSAAMLGIIGLIALIGVPIVASYTVKPYDRPEYVDIDTSESAFLIPMEGDTAEQSAFPSLAYLQERKIASKRVQIIHRWSQTGFAPASGLWIPTVRLVKIDRRPLTREWTKSSATGTSTRDQAISVETKDSVEVSPDYARHEYRRKMDAHIEALRNQSRAAGLDYFLMNTSRPLDEGLREYLAVRQGRM